MAILHGLLFAMHIVLTCLMLEQGRCAPVADEITSLPGLTKQPPFKQYSGFLQATGTRKHHYWLVESYSDPSHDPLVLWLNGGPGCSSLLGLLTENGPFTVQDNASLLYNPYTWNKNANVLFMESPVGVGFSYTTDNNITTDDNQVTDDNLAAMKSFFKKFPEYLNHPLYLTGESYGGYYIPLLAVKIIQTAPSWKLQGIGVGNGLSDMSINKNSLLYYAYFHGIFGDKRWGDLISACCHGNETRCDFDGNQETPCMVQKSSAAEMIGNSGLNVYNIYAECYPGNGSLGLTYDPTTNHYTLRDYGNFLWDIPAFSTQRLMFAKAVAIVPASRLSESIGCENTTAITTYLNDAAVRNALHIPATLPAWDVCSANVSLRYTRIYHTMTPQYHIILNAKVRVLVYNGDADLCCNYLGDEWFTDSLGQKELIARKPWYYKALDGSSQVAGFVRQFQNMTFTTIRGSGHMVPTDKPIPAYDMIQKFFNNQPF